MKKIKTRNGTKNPGTPPSSVLHLSAMDKDRGSKSQYAHPRQPTPEAQRYSVSVWRRLVLFLPLAAGYPLY